jgi:hypothetical protein
MKFDAHLSLWGIFDIGKELNSTIKMIKKETDYEIRYTQSSFRESTTLCFAIILCLLKRDDTDLII